MGCPTITTERLVLRPFRDDDIGPYLSVLRAPEVRRSLHLPESLTEHDAFMQMASWVGQWELRGTGQWAVEERATGSMVGRAGLHLPARDDWPGIEIGWALHPSVWGKGYATEAGRTSVRYAFEALAPDSVYSVILPENVRSQAVAARLGFTLVEERVLSHFPSAPHGIWRLTAEEWGA